MQETVAPTTPKSPKSCNNHISYFSLSLLSLSPLSSPPFLIFYFLTLRFPFFSSRFLRSLCYTFSQPHLLRIPIPNFFISSTLLYHILILKLPSKKVCFRSYLHRDLSVMTHLAFALAAQPSLALLSWVSRPRTISPSVLASSFSFPWKLNVATGLPLRTAVHRREVYELTALWWKELGIAIILIFVPC
jgi:hypothetical protein